MKSPPKGWPRISSSVYCEDAPAEIDWLCRAFGFEVRLKIEGDPGSIIHSELTYGEGVVMVASAGAKTAHPERPEWQSPRALNGANTQGMFLYVDDVEAHYARAKAAGAKIFRELETTDYGAEWWTDRTYGAADPEGHHWFFAQRMRTPGE